MIIPSLKTLFKSKSQDAGWYAISAGSQGIYLAKIKFVGAMPSVVRCEYHETGALSASSLEKLRREAHIDNHDISTLLAPGEYQMLLVEAPNVPADEMKTACAGRSRTG